MQEDCNTDSVAFARALTGSHLIAALEFAAQNGTSLALDAVTQTSFPQAQISSSS